MSKKVRVQREYDFVDHDGDSWFVDDAGYLDIMKTVIVDIGYGAPNPETVLVATVAPGWSAVSFTEEATSNGDG